MYKNNTLQSVTLFSLNNHSVPDQGKPQVHWSCLVTNSVKRTVAMWSKELENK